MFSVGTQVIHYVHGAGIITDKKEMQFTERPTCYLVIDLVATHSTLMVPSDKANQRLRPVSNIATLRHLFRDTLTGQPTSLPKDYKKRAEQLRDKLKSGRVKKWIEVVRDLRHRHEQKPLSQGDQKLLDRAMELLSSELALAQGIEQEKAENHLAAMLEQLPEAENEQAEPQNWWQVLTRNRLKHRRTHKRTKKSKRVRRSFDKDLPVDRADRKRIRRLLGLRKRK